MFARHFIAAGLEFRLQNGEAYEPEKTNLKFCFQCIKVKCGKNVAAWCQRLLFGISSIAFLGRREQSAGLRDQQEVDLGQIEGSFINLKGAEIDHLTGGQSLRSGYAASRTGTF